MKLKSLRGRSKESVYNFINNITGIHPIYSNLPSSYAAADCRVPGLWIHGSQVTPSSSVFPFLSHHGSLLEMFS
jgi:hypothetical protein